ncbi:hypothetical protein DSL72_001974 [Monilinia vaccinii-corymbosi]|uniref:Uncharacterized protein n=1 Tax=Monilinia vaccinii-corymbosi TaxID=61207 RepID=A0A8A3PBB4_9HELO|nr:hypothetical protein DSL72_001974 [Monilinia vaccinii-corymbosi]
MKSFVKRFKTIEDVSQYQGELDWCFNQSKLAILSIKLISLEDVECLVDIAKAWSDKQLLEILLPAIKNNIHHLAFLLATWTNISKNLSLFSSGLHPFDTIFQELVSSNLDRLDLEHWYDEIPVVKPNNRYNWPYKAPPPTPLPTRIKHEDLALILCLAYQRGMSPELDRFFKKICTEAKRAEKQPFLNHLLPFLKALARVLKDSPIALNSPVFQQLYESILNSSILRGKTKKPFRSEHWSRPTRGCGCEDCVLLDTFLSDPKNQTRVFYMTGYRKGTWKSASLLIFGVVVSKRSLNPKNRTGGSWHQNCEDVDVIRPLLAGSDKKVVQLEPPFARSVASPIQPISKSSCALSPKSGDITSGETARIKRELSSDDASVALPGEAQAKRLPAGNQWREPRKQ